MCACSKMKTKVKSGFISTKILLKHAVPVRLYCCSHLHLVYICVYNAWCSSTGWQKSTFICRDYHLLFLCLMSSYQCSPVLSSLRLFMDLLVFHFCWVSQMKSCSEDCRVRPIWLKLHRVCVVNESMYGTVEKMWMSRISRSRVYLLFSYFAVY